MRIKTKFSDLFFLKNGDRMSDSAFRMMSLMIKTVDSIWKYTSKNFKTFDIKPGQTLIDYGCGPGRYITYASNAVGESGRVIAVDIHPLAIKEVNAKVKKCKLRNVEAVLCEGYHTPVAGGTADVIYALDMFHLVDRPGDFLAELSRLVKEDGTVIIGDGHQPRSETKAKIKRSSDLKIIQETEKYVTCKKNV